MEKQMNIQEYLERFDKGEFDSPDFDTQVRAGWYDWFCKDSSLANKTKSLTQRLKQIIGSPKIDVVNHYVWFKNNCPMMGNLYDDFRIADVKTGEPIYCITPRSGHDSMNGNGEVWGRENDFKEPLFTGKWAEIKRWFNESNK